MTTTPTGHELPHWEDPPADVADAVRQVKAALRTQIEASGRTIDDVLAELEERLAPQIADVQAAVEATGTAWPVAEYDDLAAGRGLDDIAEQVRRRGVLIVRNHFDREQALAWDQSMVDYLDANDFDDVYGGPGDAFFSTVGVKKPEIFPVYWSPAQMQARQSERMAVVQRFLNSLWHCDDDRFDPDVNAMYPDRVRRRPPGIDANGLGTHIDSGTLDLWLKPVYQRAFRHLFRGDLDRFDPWDATDRIDGTQYEGSTMTSVFRTFQGWTALSDMDADQGVLFGVPIPDAVAYLLLRPLADDVPDDDMCGAVLGHSFPVTEQWHQFLLDARSSIPDVRAGDSAWWHCDIAHGVAPVKNQQGWGNVMYIPAAPWCPRNERYAEQLRAAFEDGSSPSDFPEEHYERGWPNRYGLDDLNEIGRRSLGLA